MASKNKKSSQGSSASAQGSQSASASQSQGVEDTGRSVLSVMGWIIAGVFLLLFASFVFFENDESDELSQATQDKYDAVQELYDTVRPALSQEGQEDLDIVMEYIDEDPNRLNLEKDEHPAYVVEAYDAVKSEIEESVGSGQEPEEGVQVGDEYTVVGVLEETEEDTVYGPLFKVQDETTGADLYFVFNGDQLNEIEDQSMLGERVEIDIVITDVEGGKVAYNVTDGPSLVDDGSDEESEE